MIREDAEPFDDLETADLDALLERIGDSRVVLLGEATHGTSEFYRLRARITRELILRKGFHLVAVEADWPDAAQIDRYVRGQRGRAPAEGPTFSRFPTWMWRNREVLDFVEWLREHNAGGVRAGAAGRASTGSTSTASTPRSRSVLAVPRAGRSRGGRRWPGVRYGCLTPWEQRPRRSTAGRR